MRERRGAQPVGVGDSSLSIPFRPGAGHARGSRFGLRPDHDCGSDSPCASLRMGDWATSLGPRRRMFPAVEFPCAARDGDLTTASLECVFVDFRRCEFLSPVLLTDRTQGVVCVIDASRRSNAAFFFSFSLGRLVLWVIKPSQDRTPRKDAGKEKAKRRGNPERQRCEKAKNHNRASLDPDFSGPVSETR